MAIQTQDKYLDLHGLRHHYLDGGLPDAPPLLMVHGLTREAHSFDPVFNLLGDSYRCLALDVRGRGSSEYSTPDKYNIPQYTDDVLAFLDALGLESVAYLGTSMGGIISMALADKQPERISRLAINDIGPEVAESGSKRIQSHLSDHAMKFDTYEDAIAYETQRFPWLAGRSRQDVDTQYRHMIIKNADGSCRFHYDPKIKSGRAASPEARRVQEERSWRGFRRLDCPLLLIRGADTDLLSPETVAAMQDSQPQMIVAEVPGVGHAPALSEPESQAALSAFFIGN